MRSPAFSLMIALAKRACFVVTMNTSVFSLFEIKAESVSRS
jgi:hypothetical protein